MGTNMGTLMVSIIGTNIIIKVTKVGTSMGSNVI